MILTRLREAMSVCFALALVLTVEAKAQSPDLIGINAKDGLRYTLIPAGSFLMGCSNRDEDCFPNELPRHRVTISRSFRIGVTEVTTQAFMRFVSEVGHPMPSDSSSGTSGWRNDRVPMVNTSWADAEAYCSWVGGALPTEAQWEYAARGGSDASRYGLLDEIAWTADNSGRAPLNSDSLQQAAGLGAVISAAQANGNAAHEVGQKRANDYGLFDTLGNVDEWTADWWSPSYYAQSPPADPMGPETGTLRVLRGGSFMYPSKHTRVSKRQFAPPTSAGANAGFRCIIPT